MEASTAVGEPGSALAAPGSFPWAGGAGTVSMDGLAAAEAVKDCARRCADAAPAVACVELGSSVASDWSKGRSAVDLGGALALTILRNGTFSRQ
jgi:hypothetical protein